MPRTIGYHWVKTGYGLWLPGDERGHWSEAWDAQIGQLIEPRRLHAGDPVRKRMAQARMKHQPTWLDQSMIGIMTEAIRECEAASDWSIAAMTVEATHVHLLMTCTSRDIDSTVKLIADQTTKAVHRCTEHRGPVWGKGRWLEFVDESSHWEHLVGYINRHDGAVKCVGGGGGVL